MVKNISQLKSKSVLIAEDDAITRINTIETLSMFFRKVFSASDGEEAYWIYEEEHPDIILADIVMPKKSGLKLAAMVRQKDYVTPIILMTSFTEKHMLLEAANLSVDGYLVKPVAFKSMLETIVKAVGRSHKEQEVVELGFNVIYNPQSKELFQNKILVALGSKEHELLKLLFSNPKKTFTKEEISQELWPLDTMCSSAVKSLVLRIRKKLSNELIVSVRNQGYKLAERSM